MEVKEFFQDVRQKIKDRVTKPIEKGVYHGAVFDILPGMCITIGSDPSARLPKAHGLTRELIKITDSDIKSGDLSRSAVSIYYESDQLTIESCTSAERNSVRIFDINSGKQQVAFLSHKGDRMGGENLRRFVGETPSIYIRAHENDIILLNDGRLGDKDGIGMRFKCLVNPKGLHDPKISNTSKLWLAIHKTTPIDSHGSRIKR